MTTLKLDKFVPPNDPVLIRVAEAVKIEDIVSEETQQSLKEMFEVAYGEQKDAGKPLLVGLAAPQIGISKRIILVDVSADGKGKVGDLRLYINPEITWSSEEQGEWYEGCFSTDRVCGIVSRPTKIKIHAYTKEGKIVEEEYSDYTARIFQHEIDHLNGKEFTTHITDDDKLHWVEKEEFPKYRNDQGWRDWPNKCSRERWNEIKGINKNLIISARKFAREIHKDIFLKTVSGDTRPQLEHLQEVADLVWISGGSDIEIASAWLHDSVEDTIVTKEEIEKLFGQKVSRIVEGLTDAIEIKDLPTTERKQKQADRIKNEDSSVKRIKIADQLSNIRMVITDPAPKWSVERNRKYVKGAKMIVDACRGTSEILEKRFDEEYEKSIKILNI